MARVTVFFHGTTREEVGKERIFLDVSTIKELFDLLGKEFPKLLEDIKYGRLTCLVNGRNIETLKGNDTELEQFDLVGLTMKNGGLIDFFPPDGGG
ncbi:MAG: MoaD/ThiS family protein [Caldisericaceae bacterium]